MKDNAFEYVLFSLALVVGFLLIVDQVIAPVLAGLLEFLFPPELYGMSFVLVAPLVTILEFLWDHVFGGDHSDDIEYRFSGLEEEQIEPMVDSIMGAINWSLNSGEYSARYWDAVQTLDQLLLLHGYHLEADIRPSGIGGEKEIMDYHLYKVGDFWGGVARRFE